MITTNTPQLRMFDPPLARSTDPITSHVAAESAKKFKEKHAAKILKALQVTPAGQTIISIRTGLDKNQVNRRIAELYRKGKIRLTGRMLRSDSGNPEREWMVNDWET